MSTALPDGTVTFLMTDVEQSTRLWSQRPTDMPTAISRHYAILDEVISAHGGARPVEQGEGDSVVAAFGSARAAIAAAVGVQRALGRSQPWLRVRMAVHTGEALLRDGNNYAGPAIIRCARIRSCGHGGQVLVSDTTAALVVDALPDDTSLVDLGVARLRDLDRPERVWQLTAPGLESTFPPLRSLEVAPHNVPVPLTSLIGRVQELKDVADLMAGHRLVTLTGSGGAGKTRLAQQVALDGLARHPGGTWWVELAEVSSAATVIERVLDVLGVGASSADGASTLGRVLRATGSTVLVLDNAEHLIEAVAALSARLVETCPDLELLVTSREPLGISGEVVLRVPSLAVPQHGSNVSAADLGEFDSTRLFVERAREARPNLVLDDDDAGAVAAICARLDGIPLAIELAAARARTLPLDRLAAGLDDAFRLLTGGARTALPRQQTLHASIAWSVDLLDQQDDTVLHRLAVFAASFTIDAAEVVAADGAIVARFDVLDSLARLVDKSLVQLDDVSGRYRMLETVRQWGLDRLAQRGELAEARSRHAEWCARWTEEAAALRHGIDPAPFYVEVPDLQAGLDWAMAREPEVVLRMCATLRLFLPIVGPATCERIYDFVLARDPSGVDPVIWTRAVDNLVLNAVYLERLDILALVPQARATLQAAGLPPGMGLRTIEHLPDVTVGRTDGLARLCVESADDCDDLDMRSLAAAVVLTAVSAGDLATARHHLQIVDEVLHRWGQERTPNTAGWAYAGTIDLAVLEGRLDDARASARVALTTPCRTQHAFAAAASTIGLGHVTDDRELLIAPQRWLEHEPARRMRPLLHSVRCLLALHLDDVEMAADHAARAGIDLTNGALAWWTVVPHVTAMLSAGRPDEAEAMADAWGALAGGPLSGAPLPAAVSHHSRALVALAADRDADAIDSAHALLDVADEQGYVLATIDALLLLAELGRRRSNGVAAARVAGAATSARQRIGYRVPWALGLGHRSDELAEQLSEQHPDAFAEGQGLDLAAAVEYVRRMRGGRGRPSFGWAGLTPTEQQVAELAAEGSTNAQIAERLLMRPATVKTHLTRIFSKVGVANRTELAHLWTSEMRTP